MDGREKTRMPVPARIYICILVAAGLVAAWDCFRGWTPELPLRFVVYVIIALASSGMKVALPGVNGNISVNYIFTLLALLELSVPEALALALLSVSAQTFWRSRNRPGAIHLVFNLGSITLTVLAAAAVYAQPWLAGIPAGEFLRLAIAGVVYFVVNTLSVSIVIALTEGRGVSSIWKGFLDWSFAYYLVGVSLAEMVYTSIERLGWA